MSHIDASTPDPTAAPLTPPGLVKPDLAYIALAVDDPAAVMRLFADDLGLAAVDVSLAGGGSVPAISIGDTALAFFAPDDPFLGAGAHKGVHHLAVPADDPSVLADRLGVDVDQRTPGAGLNGASQLGLATDSTFGMNVRLTEPLGLGAQSNTPIIERVDHIGIASSDNRGATELFSGRLGCPVESMQTDMEVRMAVESFTSDKYGVVYHNRDPEPVGGLRCTFLTVGDCELELLQPFDPAPVSAAELVPDHNSAGNTKGDRGAIGRYIDRRGPGLHHLALKTPDIDDTLGRLHANGHRVIDHVGRPGGRASRIGFLHPSALGGLLIHFVERTEVEA